MIKVGMLALAAQSVQSFTLQSNFASSRVISRASASAVQMASFYDFSASTLDGKEASMKDFEGKPVLILNVATL